MPTSPTTSVIARLRRAALLRDVAAVGDGELLGGFIDRRDEAALATLIERHGSMVWGVCRRLLSHHDAEDAFQATFLVLVRKAASVVPREMVGNWLYGVAHQTALQARRSAARQSAREVQVPVMPDTEAVQQDQWADVQPLLDQELSRLPDNFRAVIVLCDLEGRTRKEAACQLGCPEGTVAGRLARARAKLAKRLTARGVTLSGGALAAVLSQNAASAGVPNSVVSKTISAASNLAAGQGAATGPVSAKVAALTEGVLKAMIMSKLKAVVAVVLVLGFLTTVATVLTFRTAAAQDDKKPTAEKPVKPAPKPEPEAFTAWGKEVDGVQAGLGFPVGAKRAYSPGETVKLVVRVRNNGKKDVKFSYFNESFYEGPPVVTDDKGKPVTFEGAGFSGVLRLVEVDLAAGKQIDLCEPNVELRPASDVGKHLPVWTLFGTGKFQFQYERVGGNIGTGGIEFDPILSQLQTGKLELEVKEPVIAWGKEVGGLQAGLGFHPDHKRAYSHGETVKLVVRVRNVGKEEVRFHYARQFFIEKPPAVTDDKGKPVPPLPRPVAFGDYGIHTPEEVNLAPGKGIELYELKVELRSGNSVTLDSVSPDRLWASGKVRIQYERLASPDIDEILGKLATGKLDLEIKSDLPPTTRKDTPQNNDREDADRKPIKIGVYIEKVNIDTSTITASCVLIGEVDNVTKPLRFENLQVAVKARITDRGKELKLADLQLLPRDTPFYLFLKAYEFGGFEVVGIETIRK
jgi:RNA polymerase sigma factor (sigma-70 family)